MVMMQMGKVCIFILKSQIPAAYDFQLIIKYGPRTLKKLGYIQTFLIS